MKFMDFNDHPVARQTEQLLTKIISLTFYGLVILVPLFFLPFTSEVLEWNKRALIMVGAAIVALAWLGRGLIARRVEYRNTLVTMLSGLFLLVTGVSSWLAANPYYSLVGDNGQQKSSFVTLLGLVTLLVIGVQVWREPSAVRRLSIAMVVGGTIAAVFALLQGLGLFILPFAFAQSVSFTTAGTYASLGVYLAFVATLAGGMLLSPHGDHPCSGKWCRIANWFLFAASILSILIVSIVEFRPVLISLMIGAAVLVGFAITHARRMKGVSGIFVPVIGLIVAALTIAIGNPINLKIPAELMPSLKTSASVALQTVKINPLLGSGPGTFISDYTRFKPAEVNKTQFWNVRFDRSSSRFLTILATTGVLGAMTYLMLCAGVVWMAVTKLRKNDEEAWHVLVGVFAGWLTLFVSRFVYSSTMTLEFAFWMATAMVVALATRSDRDAAVDFDRSPRAGLSMAFVFIVASVAVTAGAVAMGFRYSAESSYRYALELDRNGGTREQVAAELVKAVQLNPNNDVYLRNLAVARLAQATAVLQSKLPEKEAGEKDDAYKTRMETLQQAGLRKAASLAGESIALAKRATELDPNLSANWTVLATVYQNLAGITTGAADLAIEAFGKSIALEPTNPALLTELGKIYLAQSDDARRDLESKDEAIKAAAKTKVDDLLAKALEQFQAAIALKGDYGAAHYNVALVFDRQGKLKEAIGKMETVTQYNPNDVGVAFQLSLLYYRDGRKDDAIRYLQALVKYSPNFSNARWYLASMLEEKGDLDGAIAQLEKLAELNPDNADVKAKLAEIKAKRAGSKPDGATGLPQPVDAGVTAPAQVGQ